MTQPELNVLVKLAEHCHGHIELSKSFATVYEREGNTERVTEFRGATKAYAEIAEIVERVVRMFIEEERRKETGTSEAPNYTYWRGILKGEIEPLYEPHCHTEKGINMDYYPSPDEIAIWDYLRDNLEVQGDEATFRSPESLATYNFVKDPVSRWQLKEPYTITGGSQELEAEVSWLEDLVRLCTLLDAEF